MSGEDTAASRRRGSRSPTPRPMPGRCRRRRPGAGSMKSTLIRPGLTTMSEIPGPCGAVAHGYRHGRVHAGHAHGRGYGCISMDMYMEHGHGHGHVCVRLESSARWKASVDGLGEARARAAHLAQDLVCEVEGLLDGSLGHDLEQLVAGDYDEDVHRPAVSIAWSAWVVRCLPSKEKGFADADGEAYGGEGVGGTVGHGGAGGAGGVTCGRAWWGMA